MHPFSRRSLASLAAALIGVAAIGAPVLATPAHAATSTPSPRPTQPASATSPSPSPTSPAPSSGASSVSAAKDITFGIGPAVQVPKDHYFDGRPYISSITQAGGVVRDAVAVVNVGRKPVTLSLYPADANQNGSTTFQLSLRNQKPRSTGAWLSLEGQKSLRITVPASHAGPHGSNIPGRIVIPFKARVPLRANPGDHVAAIVAELDAPAKNKNGANITLQQRLGVAVYIHLTGQLRSGLQVGHLKARWAEPGNALGTGRYTVSYTVTNVGNVRMNASTLLNTTRWFLGPVRSYPGEIVNLFPGSTVNVSITLPHRFGLGPWHVTASAFGTPVDPTVVLTTPPTSQSTSLWAVPWILLAIIVGTILVIWYAQRRYRKWRKDRKDNPRIKGGQRSKKRAAPTKSKKSKKSKADQRAKKADRLVAAESDSGEDA